MGPSRAEERKREEDEGGGQRGMGERKNEKKKWQAG